ncbi:MAG: hypothetical protein J6X80_01415 [Lachnospiraceae bacterium]|nr:hypothetical protein [Lachnospiraceae bacterium]
MKKRLLYFFTILLSIFFMAGCGKKGNTYTYKLDEIKHNENFYVKKTVYYEDRVEITFNTSPDDCYIYSPDDSQAQKEVKGNKLIIYSDNPEAITSLVGNNSVVDFKFRYLNSDKYATLWAYWADDLGWTDYAGDEEKFYTLEEQRQQAIAQYQREEAIKQAQAESDELFYSILKGKWISDDGDYFDITENDFNKCLLYYDAGRDMYTECPGISFKESWNYGNAIEAFYAENGWGAYYGFDLFLSNDKNTFEYDEKTFYLADDEVWSEVDVRYVHPVMVLFDNADMWKITDEAESDIVNMDDTDSSDDEENSETEEKFKEVSECHYAVTDLDMDGFSEVIVSGYSADNKEYFMDIYEATAEGSVEKIKTNNLSNKEYAPTTPALYKTEESPCFVSETGYQDVYDCLIYGEEKRGENVTYTQYYLMSVQVNTVVLQKVCAKELTEGEDGVNGIYFDADGNEITSVDYAGLLKGVRNEADLNVLFTWFDEITIENMADSMGAYLKSVHFNE